MFNTKCIMLTFAAESISSRRAGFEKNTKYSSCKSTFVRKTSLARDPKIDFFFAFMLCFVKMEKID